jgi:hypothetical protein
LNPEFQLASPQAADDLPGESNAGFPVLLLEWASAAGERLKSSVQLVMAETRLAVTSMILMIFLVTLAAGAILFAWAFLVLTMLQLASLAGLSLTAALGLLCLFHVGLALLLWRLATRLGDRLEFTATRRLLSPGP